MRCVIPPLLGVNYVVLLLWLVVGMIASATAVTFHSGIQRSCCWTTKSTLTSSSLTERQPPGSSLLSSISTWDVTKSRRLLELRGGSSDAEGDEDDDEEEEYDNDEEEEEEEEESDSALEERTTLLVSGQKGSSVIQQTLRFVGRLTVKTFRMTARILSAALSGDEEEEEADSNQQTTVWTKITRTLGRMWKAAFSPDFASSDEEDAAQDLQTAAQGDYDEDEGTMDVDDSSKATTTAQRPEPDFGAFLAKSYQAKATRYSDTDGEDVASSVLPVLGGTLMDALRVARSQSRLLLVLIPSARPGKSKLDVTAVQSFLSKDVADMAEKRARKKETGGSFLLWSCKAGSPEAVVATKRLQAQPTNQKGQKRPILMAVYPAQILSASKATLVPKSLAQHHCSPPPSPEIMVAWLNALRKRHAKQYASMQLEAKEMKYYKERKEGYKDSIQSDKERQDREKRQEQERLAKEKAERERQEALHQRREMLRESLPDEPSKGDANTKTISLRLPDGQSKQRRFASNVELSVVFDWADVDFEMERETLVLTTMNGKKTFSWDNDKEMSLQDAGIGRMTGLRVLQKQDATKSDEAKEASPS